MDNFFYNELGKELKMKRYERDMLKKTLKEMLDRGSSDNASILQMGDDIIELNNWISKAEASLEAYNNVAKERISEMKDDVYKEPTSTATEGEIYSYYHEKEHTVPEEVKTLVKEDADIHDEINHNTERMLQRNIFTVEIEGYDIPKTMVKSFIDYGNGKVTVRIYDFVDEHDVLYFPVLRRLQRIMKAGGLTNIEVKHYNSMRTHLYSETYTNCKLAEIDKDEFNTRDTDFATLDLIFDYEEVTYDCANK